MILGFALSVGFSTGGLASPEAVWRFWIGRLHEDSTWERGGKKPMRDIIRLGGVCSDSGCIYACMIKVKAQDLCDFQVFLNLRQQPWTTQGLEEFEGL